MRAIWFILKLPLKILMAPVILSLTLFVWICVGIVYVSGLVLGLISMVVALLGVAVLITYSGIVKKTAHPTCPVMPPAFVLTATVSA